MILDEIPWNFNVIDEILWNVDDFGWNSMTSRWSWMKFNEISMSSMKLYEISMSLDEIQWDFDDSGWNSTKFRCSRRKSMKFRWCWIKFHGNNTLRGSLGVLWEYSECILGVLWEYSGCTLGVLWDWVHSGRNVDYFGWISMKFRWCSIKFLEISMILDEIL